MNLWERLVSALGSDAGGEAVSATFGAGARRRVVAGHLRCDMSGARACIVRRDDCGARVDVGCGLRSKVVDGLSGLEK